MPDRQAPHETSDASPTLVLGTIILTAAFVLAASGLLWLGWKTMAAPKDEAPSMKSDLLSADQPLLQARPQTDLIEQQQQWDHRLRSVGWVDREAGIVYMPIDRAMTLLVQRGLAEEQPEEQSVEGPE